MKLIVDLFGILFRLVAPRRGAWIETPFRPVHCRAGAVAPRRGAWIETYGVPYSLLSEQVAPRRGAWIETVKGAL